ncbi:MAG: AraC family transcriptional regulator [Tannerellaceae bacterium]|nr:AraC family transcriptional regulator [Tannerellaceae bacterium]
MKSIPTYHFYKTKYGEELLVDVVILDNIRKYIKKHPVHTLSYFDVTFITKGNGCFSIDEKPYALHPEDVVFSKPGEIRSWSKTDMLQGYALIFEEEFLLSFFNDSSFIQNLSYFNRERLSAKINITPIQARIYSLLQNIRTEITNEQSKDKHILRALLYEMLALLNREYEKSHVPLEEKFENRHIDNFITLVDTYFKVHHTIKFYAGELCITPNYLNEIVQKSIGTSSKGYIQHKIIQESKRLLSYTNLSVSEIARDLNFENLSYFIRLFRKLTRFTPLQYRHNAKR